MVPSLFVNNYGEYKERSKILSYANQCEEKILEKI